MQTIKTAVVVVLLLAVCYGAIVALNAPDPKLPPELEQWAEQGELDLSMDPGEMVAIEMPQPKSAPYSSNGTLRTEELANTPNQLPTSLPKFDLQGSHVQSNSSPQSQYEPGKSESLIPELAGPDGPMVLLEHSPASSSQPNIKPQTASESNSPGLLASSASLPNVSAPTLPSFPSTNHTASPTALPGHLTSASSGGVATLPSSTNTSLGSAHSVATSTPPSLAGINTLSLNLPENPTSAAESLQNGGNLQSPNTATSKLPTMSFGNAREQTLKLAKEGKLKDALFTMSMFYDSVELTRDEHVDMLAILDALAAEVIYSRQHLLEKPYRAVPGDTVDSIAIKHSITRELLVRINGLDNSNVVLPSTELKVVRGPFRAEVDLTRGELTLLVGELYAGRFPISVGQDPFPREGTFEIVDKRIDRSYYGAGSNPIPANDPRNPYGGYWLNLGQDMCIHGTAEMATTELSKAGCISLAPIDAADVYAILAQGTKVRVHR